MLLETEDSVTLRAALWPATGVMRGGVVLCQGRTEYIEKAYEWIGEFRARGLSVCAFDWRGQGVSQRLLSDRLRGHVPDFKGFQSDLDAIMPMAREAIGDVPLILFGHSMGGLAVVRYLSRGVDTGHVPDGAILSAPMLKLALPWTLQTLMKPVSAVATALGLGGRYVASCDDRTVSDRGFEDNVLTHDRRRFDAHGSMMNRHPDLRLGGVTWGWSRAAFREMAAVRRLPRGWLKTPTLILVAEKDSVVSNAAIARLARHESFVEHVMLSGSYHEPMMEVDAVRDQVWAAIDGFLDRVAPQSVKR